MKIHHTSHMSGLKNRLEQLPDLSFDYVLDEAEYLYRVIIVQMNRGITSVEIPFVISSENETYLLRKGYNTNTYINNHIGKLRGTLCTKISWNAPNDDTVKDVLEKIEKLKLETQEKQESK